MFIFWRMAVPRKWFSEVLHSASGLVQHWTTQYYVVTFRVNLTNTFRFRIDYLNLVVHDFQSWNLTTDDAQVEVCLWLRRLLTYKIPLYSVWCPHHHVLRFLRPGGFGEPTLTVTNSTTCTMTYLRSLPASTLRWVKRRISISRDLLHWETQWHNWRLCFLHVPCELFLLESPPHPDNPHCQSVWPNYVYVVFSPQKVFPRLLQVTRYLTVCTRLLLGKRKVNKS
jgi:hypothetical protein